MNQITSDKEAEIKLKQARIRMLLDSPFFGTLAMYLEIKESKKTTTFGPMTCATDGRMMYYNPDFIKALKLDEIAFVISHEVLHVALRHIDRCGTRVKEIWNLAIDFATNDTIGDMFKRPEGTLWDSKYHNWSAERIYEDIVKGAIFVEVPGGGIGIGGSGGNQKEISDGIPAPQKWDGHDYSKKGKGKDGKGNTEDAKKFAEEMGRYWKNALSAASIAQRQRSTMPGELGQLINGELEPKVDWRSVFWNFVTERISEEYRMYPPDRRHIHNELYLPSIEGQRVVIAVTIDSSQSIDDLELEQFVSEVKDMLNNTEGIELHLMVCDTRVTLYEVLTREDNLTELSVHGRGGTSFVPPFKKLEDESVIPCSMIYLTDLCGDFPDEIPLYPVLWVVVGGNNNPPPFGQVIHMEIDKYRE